jgi:MoaA/NifB/PqqE/SkfB family radical SAM enzyme/predicted SAM-dependent methyltransferase
MSLITPPPDLKNEADAVKEVMAVKGVNQDAPKIFAIETTLACNLRCPECAIGGDMVRRKKQLMRFDQYRIIADKIRAYAKYVYLHIWGEPMLNPDILEMVRYTTPFARTNISTNGMNMTRELAEQLILSGVSDVIVSIDGVTQEVYERYRVGGDVTRALNALKLLAHYNRHHSSKVNITPQFIVFKHNQHQIETFQEICGSLKLTPFFKPPYIRTGSSRFQPADDPKYVRAHYPTIPALRAAMVNCTSPREVFNVQVDGSVVVCCHDYEGITRLGNLFAQDTLEIWNNSRFQQFREAVASGSAPNFCIQSCMTWFLEDTPPLPAAVTKSAPAGTSMGGTGRALKINLCSGQSPLDGFINIDISQHADIVLDLEHKFLPFNDDSVDAVVCISAINYFSYSRGAEIVKDVYRVLRPGGVARFATQDLKVLSEKYLARDRSFFFQKLADGRDRFQGLTFADKFNEFFYGFYSGDKHCKYVYDFESLEVHFRSAGFAIIDRKEYRQSRIAGAEAFDNRPEQMFFLEAVKDKQAISIDSHADDRMSEPKWQSLMMILEVNPVDRDAVMAAAEVLNDQQRYADLTKLLSTYLAERPNDHAVCQFHQLVLEKSEQKLQRIQAVARSRQPDLDSLNERINRLRPDRDHLAACMAWLRQAQQVRSGGGVAAMYHMDQERWDVDYPETTGYIIPTFLKYAHLTDDVAWRTWAVQMGEWEIAIQRADGGIGEPPGVSGLTPRVFNTGQVILGWVALHRETGDARFLTAARKAADWILTTQDPDGKWVRNTYSGKPKAYKSRVAWALLELFDVTGEERFRTAAESAVGWILSQAQPNGWFANNSLTLPDRPWTHLIGYVLVGLLEIYRLGHARIDRKNLLNVLHHAGQGIAAFYVELKKNRSHSRSFTTLAGTLDSDWRSRDGWSCVTGNAQIAFWLRRLAEETRDSLLVDAADGLHADLKRIHFVDGVTDPALYGGLPGAYPVGGPYCAYSIPNWGVKFFADALMQTIIPMGNRTCLS